MIIEIVESRSSAMCWVYMGDWATRFRSRDEAEVFAGTLRRRIRAPHRWPEPPVERPPAPESLPA